MDEIYGRALNTSTSGGSQATSKINNAKEMNNLEEKEDIQKTKTNAGWKIANRVVLYLQVYWKRWSWCRYFRNSSDYLLTEHLLTTAFVARENKKSGITTILGNMEYLKRGDKVWKITRSMGLKNKLLGAGKQNMNIISEKRKSSDSLNLKGKELRKEIKNQHLLYETNC